jgi:UDP-N-acetylglucosamine--N-acetylmuramyl-(pentapeptide) pyrophosphoryl-undecaprenol N-acetylglucosamine transferase
MHKIVITGGHLTPTLAVIEELIKRGGWEIYFLGRKYAAEGDRTPSLESMIIPEKGIRFVSINPGRLQQKFTKHTIPAFLRLPLGFIQGFYHLARLKPDIILSFGSYVGVPVVVCGWFLGIPIMIHQQTLTTSRADKINARFAQKIAISWKETLNDFPKNKVVLTGNPIRPQIFKVNQKIWENLNLEKGLPLVLITGGNQGSHRLNLAVEGALEKILTKYNLFHQTGHLRTTGDFDRLSEKKEKLPEKLKIRYHLKRYISGEEWGTLLNKADLVVSRAGINTVSELLALGKPALLIPIPWLYGDEQTKNAEMLKKIGLAEILPQEKLTPQTLYQTIEKMIRNLENYRCNLVKAKKLIIPNAAQKIIDEVEKIS